MTHGHGHLLFRAAHFLGDATGSLERVGDGLLGENVHLVGKGLVDDLFVKRRGDDDGAEVGGVVIEGARQVGVALLGRKLKVLGSVAVDVTIDVHGSDDLDEPVCNVRREEVLTPTRAEAAGADMDHLVCHDEVLSPPPLTPEQTCTRCLPEQPKAGL